jgi:hypothetical protein
MTRGTGLLVSVFYSGFVWLILSNEDAPAPQGWPVVIGMLICILSTALAFRWQRVGGMLLVFGSIGLGMAAVSSAFITRIGWVGAVVSLALPLPFLIVGGLALADAEAVE